MTQATNENSQPIASKNKPLADVIKDGRSENGNLSEKQKKFCQDLIALESALIKTASKILIDPNITQEAKTRLQECWIDVIVYSIEKDLPAQLIKNQLLNNLPINKKGLETIEKKGLFTLQVTLSTLDDSEKKGSDYPKKSFYTLQISNFLVDVLSEYAGNSFLLEAAIAHEFAHIIFDDKKTIKDREAFLYSFFNNPLIQIPPEFNFDSCFVNSEITNITTNKPMKNDSAAELADTLSLAINKEHILWKRTLERRADAFAAKMIGTAEPFFHLFQILACAEEPHSVNAEWNPHDNFEERLKLIKEVLSKKSKDDQNKNNETII